MNTSENHPILSDENTPLMPHLWYHKSSFVGQPIMEFKYTSLTPTTYADAQLSALNRAIAADAIRCVLPFKFQWVVRS